jgi:hypothetical protein
MATYYWPFEYQGTASSSATTQYLNNTAAIWTNWASTTTVAGWFNVGNPPAPRQLTREEQRAEELRIAEHRLRMQREHRERQRARERANGRAEKLLAENLNDEQTDQYARRRAFRVRGSRGGVYSIHDGVAYQVDPNDDRYSMFSICIHGSGVPEADNMLAKKLMIETDEDTFRRIGNFSRQRSLLHV